MSILKRLWLELTNRRVAEESQARQEYLTRMVFILVSAGLLLMTVFVFLINYGVGEPNTQSTFIMLGMDLLALVGWFLIGKGHWRWSGALLPFIFIFFSGYMIFTVGPVTTAVLQFAIAILLAGMLFGNRVRWIIFCICNLIYLVAGWGGGEHDVELYLTSGTMLFVSLGGIALLDWFFSNLLNKSLTTVYEREAKLQSIFRAAPIGIGMVVNRVIQESNDTLCQMTGYSREELIGNNALILYPSQEEYEFVGAEKYRQIREQEVGTVETRWRRKDGVIRDILLSSVPLDPADWGRGVTFSALDITERKEYEKNQKALLREKEVLLAEVRHRVKNNLQVVASLLNLQAEGIEDEHILEVLEESRNRIQSMALVHKQLYRYQEYANIDFGEYVGQLASTLFNMYQVDLDRVEFQVEAKNIHLDLERAIPSGLLLNELITNSLKYAFPDDEKGQIYIRLEADKENLLLEFGDNGVGLPNHIDFDTTQTFGLQLISLLATHDLHGSITLDRKNGTKYCIDIPLSQSEQDN